MSKKIKKKKKRFSFKRFLLFLIFEIAFTAVSLTLLVFHGPFTNVKNFVVTTAMGTFKHQYIAKLFLSNAEIKNIQDKANASDSTENQDLNKLNFSNHSLSNDIELIDGIKGTTFNNGKALIIKNRLKVKVGYAKELGTKGETTSEMAKRYNALAAVNGGGFNDVSPNGKEGSGVGNIPEGFVISDGQIVWPKGTDNKDYSVMALTEDGKLVVGGSYTSNQLSGMKVKEAICFGPTLFINGKPHISSHQIGGVQPRTVVAQNSEGDIIFLTIDGRKGIYLGATLEDLQKVFTQSSYKELNTVQNAVCLDGGYSTTMYYNGKVINDPSDPLGERSVPTIVYVKR